MYPAPLFFQKNWGAGSYLSSSQLSCFPFIVISPKLVNRDVEVLPHLASHGPVSVIQWEHPMFKPSKQGCPTAVQIEETSSFFPNELVARAGCEAPWFFLQGALLGRCPRGGREQKLWRSQALGPGWFSWLASSGNNLKGITIRASSIPCFCPQASQLVALNEVASV